MSWRHTGLVWSSVGEGVGFKGNIDSVLVDTMIGRFEKIL